MPKGRIKGSTYKKIKAYDINEIKKRFLSKIIINEKGCWIWNGPVKQGYGGFWCYINGKGKDYPAHRISYILFKDAVPDDKMVLHKNECNNKLCVNPDHLYIGTHKDNMKDLREIGTLAGKNNPNFGIKCSEEKRIKLSKSNSEAWKKPEIRNKYLKRFEKENNE